MKLLFTLFNLLFLVAAVYLGYSAYQKISMDQGKDKYAITKPTEKTVSSRKKPPPSPENYRAIIDRNLFHTKENTAEKPESPKLTQSEPLKPTKLLVNLWGTVTSSADGSYAIIEDKNNKDQSLYRIGDTIQDATVKEIFREKVVLTVQGKDEVLEMEKLESGGPVMSRMGPQPQRMVGPTRPPSVRRMRLKRSELEKALKSEEGISNQARVRPHFTEGRQDGIMLTGIKPNSIYRRLGLRNGDILMGIDEADIQSAENISAISQRLSSASELTLKIKRRGRPTTMNYTIE